MPYPNPTPAPSGATLTVADRAVTVLMVALVIALLLSGGGELAALQKMAGYDGGGETFAKVKTYLDNLRDGLIPLAIPLGAIGLTGGGVAYMVGNPMAQRILGGVVIGVALALTAPSIIA